MKRFEKLTRFIPVLEQESASESLGEWITDDGHAGTREDPYRLGYVSYGKAADGIRYVIHEYADEMPELRSYMDILADYGMHTGEDLQAADLSKLDVRCLLAMILTIVRQGRFCDGLLLDYLENGCMLAWLKRLDELDVETEED